MGKKKIQIGIIGCSRIAESSVIPSIISSKFGKLSSIGSRKIEKAKKFSVNFQCKEFGTYEDVIDNKNIDAIYISTPVGLHEEWAIKALKAGKHVLCEKSSTVNYESAKRMVNTAKKNNCRILEGLMFRFHPSHKKIIDFIQAGKIGKKFSFYGEYGFPDIPHTDIRYKKELGGGVLNDAGCYPICASRIIFGENPKEVVCNLIIDKNSDVDVKASISLRYSQNMMANMVVGYGLGYQSKYRIWGEKGLIQLSRAYNIPANMKPKIRLEFPDKEKEILTKSANHFKLMIDAFCKEINESNSFFNFEEDLLMQAKIMEACRISHYQQKIVKIDNRKF
ncbi:Gfo/Idh/MocA family oxidoreductase [Nitrosarchaeum koreense]|nr:Gfo/Idh/MocA family oxidoreductase [Nitrosarchaeum koreense]